MTPEELHNIYAAEREFWWYQGMRAIMAAFMDRLFERPGGLGLDAGCGTGFNALEFEKRHGMRMLGVDFAALAIQYGRQLGFPRSLLASVTDLPFPAGRFDLITSFDVLSHLSPSELERALSEFGRVLRPGGWVVLRVPAFHALRSRHSQWVAERHRFRARELLRLLSRFDFQVLRWSYANSFLSPIALTKFRLWEPLTRAPAGSGVSSTPPAWLNRLLRGVLLCEAGLIRRGCHFLFGQSLIVVAQKPASSHNS